jgi:AcrR family transcriptional regulator
VGVRLLVVEDIAREAGISKGSFYSFYPSREDFVLSVFESWESEYRGALTREVVQGAGTARERIERFFLGTFDILEREPGLARLGMKDIQAIIERITPERLKAHQAADNRALEETFGRWVSEGMLAPDVIESFHGLVPALFSIAMHRQDFPPGTFAPAVKLIAEALALRITEGAGKGGTRPAVGAKIRPRGGKGGRK